ncbi:hypothetical protein MBLNU459_g6062t1 [Dothideomycetes sp. NU459]
MSSTDDSVAPSQTAPRASSQVPSLPRQACYFATGSLAGAVALLPDLAWTSLVLKTPTSVLPFFRTHAPAVLFRAGTRFWTFDHVRSRLSSSPLPVWVVNALGGASGGFSEVLFHSLLQRRRPSAWALGSQSLRLFCCFGTYTFLSTTLSEQLPPKPFPWCWCMGAVAGALGNTIAGAVDGVRGRALWLGAAPKGALTIGTVISVQATSCAALREAVGV